MRKSVRNALTIAGVLLFTGVILFIVWGLTPLGPAPEALAALESNAMMTISDQGDFITFTPAGHAPITGFIFYPGGHVDYRSYAPVAQRIAARGYLVALVKMPLSLAVFGVDRADGVIASHPGIRYWVIGGHSLGGSMAASYAKAHQVSIQGVAFWASYPPEGDDLSSTDLKGLSTYGSEDQVLDMENYRATLPLLPPGSIRQVIQGGNHAQFGDYGPQPGDGTATISAADQQAQAADLTARLLRAVEGE
jgi:pimeloyl-ACP methyl ester carboxylesterase